MKQSEAIRIPALLAARQPRPVVAEAVIEGIRMLVIIGNDVDTVIQYTRGGGVKMPQISTYDEVAEEAARADELLAKQRASGRKNTTGEGVEWPRDWKLKDAKAAGKIWYSAPKPDSERPRPSVAQGVVGPTGVISHPLNISEARQRLSDAVKALAQLDAVRLKLEKLKEDARYLERQDFVWLSLVESLSSMGNSRGYYGLFGNPENYKSITFEALSVLTPAERMHVLADTMARAAVRRPDTKAKWLAEDFERVKKMGGPVAAKTMLLNQPDRERKIAFLKRFAGIGDKYARNIFMNVYHHEFRQSIAVDSRIESVLAALGLSELKTYEAREQFCLEAARLAGLEGVGS